MFCWDGSGPASFCLTMSPVLLALAALLVSAGADSSYDQLPDALQAGVDLALVKLRDHAGIQNHFLFFKSVTQSSIEPGYGVTFVFHHFHLKPTDCPRGTSDASTCRFRHDRPLIDCSVCYKLLSGRIEAEPKPYLHCIHRPSLTEEMKKTRVQHCNTLGYSSGAPTLLASTSES